MVTDGKEVPSWQALISGLTNATHSSEPGCCYLKVGLPIIDQASTPSPSSDVMWIAFSSTPLQLGIVILGSLLAEGKASDLLHIGLQAPTGCRELKGFEALRCKAGEFACAIRLLRCDTASVLPNS
jgi:hypothetical protein